MLTFKYCFSVKIIFIKINLRCPLRSYLNFSVLIQDPLALNALNYLQNIPVMQVFVVPTDVVVVVVFKISSKS